MENIDFNASIFVDEGVMDTPEQPNDMPVFDSVGDYNTEDLSYSYEEESDAEMTLEEVYQGVIQSIRENPYLLDRIKKEVSEVTLKNIANFFRTKGIEIDLWELYKDSQDFRDFLTYLISCDLTSKGIDTNRGSNFVVYYILPQDYNDIYYKEAVLDNDIGIYKSSPAITTFSKKVIDKLAGHFPKYATKGSLYKNRLKINAKKVKVKSDIVKDNDIVDMDLSMVDNLTLANMVMDGELSAKACKETLPKERYAKVATLLKVLKDNK